jgi:ribose transport system substrate-binding protein
MEDTKVKRRSLLTAGTTAALAGAFGLPMLSKEAKAQAAGKE